MKILLLNSPWINNTCEYGIKAGTRWAAKRRKGSSMPYFPFPYFLASAAAVLKKAGLEAHIKDAIAEEITKEECMAYIEKLQPDIVIIEAFTPSIYEDLAFMKEVKERINCLTVFCGAHATALPEEILKNSFMDFVFLGEFDYTLRELTDFVSRGRTDFDKIYGLAYRQENEIKLNPRRKPIQNLDELPFPERDELPMHKYTEPFSRYYPNAKITTSRGCPHNCIFCIEPVMYGEHVYRKRSVKLVIDEIRLLRDKYKLKEVYFDDPLFTIPRAVEIAEGILNNNLKMAWSCWMDWKVSVEQLKLLKKSGCIGIKFGIESSSSEILDTANKLVNIDKIKKLIRTCKDLGMLRHGSFMFGLPGETTRTLKSTMELAFSLDLTSCQLAIATPLPGTPFYRMAKENGCLVTDDWSKFEPHYSSVVSYPACKKEEIESVIEQAREKKIKQLFKNPLVMFRYAVKLCKIKGFKGFMKEFFCRISFLVKALSSGR